MRTREEIAETLLDEVTAYPLSRSSARVAILSALDAEREGALREAEDVLQRYLSKQDHQNQTVYDATCIMIENIRLIASRPSPAAEPAPVLNPKTGKLTHPLSCPAVMGPPGECRCGLDAASALRRIGGDLPSPEAQQDNLERNLDALGAEPAGEINRKPYPVTPTCGAIKSVPLICSLDAGHDGPHAACHVTPTICWEPSPSPAPDEERNRCRRCRRPVFASDFAPDDPVICLECGQHRLRATLEG